MAVKEMPPIPARLAVPDECADEKSRPAPSAAQVELILSAIETGQHGRRERRHTARASFRTQAVLRLFSDPSGVSPWTIYTRDANPRGLGFITPHRLPLGYGGLLEITSPTGQVRCIHCTLLRCREAAPGWYEGSLYFNRHQADFAMES